jgi:protein-S-isoprenylcysteine O-methyltransferase Ste14
MLARAINAFIAIPGLVAFAIPIATGVVTRRPPQHAALALTLVVLGAAILVWCVREFYVAGRGTLVPWARPKRLVTSGPYRFTRNPMYVATLIILIGWSVLGDFPGAAHLHGGDAVRAAGARPPARGSVGGAPLRLRVAALSGAYAALAATAAAGRGR